MLRAWRSDVRHRRVLQPRFTGTLRTGDEQEYEGERERQRQQEYADTGHKYRHGGHELQFLGDRGGIAKRATGSSSSSMSEEYAGFRAIVEAIERMAQKEEMCVRVSHSTNLVEEV